MASSTKSIEFQKEKMLESKLAASTEEIAATTEQNLASIQKVSLGVNNLYKVINELEANSGKFIV